MEKLAYSLGVTSALETLGLKTAGSGNWKRVERMMRSVLKKRQALPKGSPAAAPLEAQSRGLFDKMRHADQRSQARQALRRADLEAALPPGALT